MHLAWREGGRERERERERERGGAKLSKQIDNSLYNALRSIYEDSLFVSQLWPQLPLLANLHCGPWYSPKFHSTCFFKSADGHTNNCSFNTVRLNLHIPYLPGLLLASTIEAKLDDWTEQFKASDAKADIASLAACLKKPLRPLWISHKSVIGINKVPHHDCWDFAPIILVSASSWIGLSQSRSTSMFRWHYMPGAADNEKSWAKGLSPTLFWNHVYDLINSSPDVCNQKVIDIVERSKVHRAYTGESAPQIKAIPLNLDFLSYKKPSPALDIANIKVHIEPSEGLAIGASQFGVNTDFWGEIDFHVNKAIDRVGEAVKRGRELEAEVVELRKLKQRVEDSITNEQILKAQNEELKHTNENLNNKLQNTAGLMMKLGEEERKVKTLTEELKKAEEGRLAALKQKDSFRLKRDFLLRDNKSKIVLLRQAEDSKKLAFELAKVKKQFDEVEKLYKEAEEDCVAIGQEQFDNAINQILALNPGVAIQTDRATSIGLVEGCNIINY